MHRTERPFVRRLTAPLALCLAGAGASAQATYFPPPESAGGWRTFATTPAPSAATKQAIRDTVSIEWDRLEQAWDLLEPYGGAFLVLRDGWLVGEWGLRQPYNIASCTKSLTSVAMQRLFDLSDAGQLAVPIAEDDPAWPFLPATWGADPKKRPITVRQLLTMSSGLLPDDDPQKTAAYRDRILTLPVVEPPDSHWVYASAPVDVASIVLQNAAGRTLETFFRQEIEGPLGLGPTYWSSMGVSTLGSAYCIITPRDLARVAYCLLRGGRWNAGAGEFQAISAQRASQATAQFSLLPATTFGVPNNFTNDPHSQLRYGKLFWNSDVDTPFVSSSLPAGAYYMSGFGTNFCLVVPNYDLIVIRLGSWPAPWDDDLFVEAADRVMDSLLDREVHAKVQIVGEGCGPGEPPLLYATPPVLGTTFSLSVPDLPPGQVVALVWGRHAPVPLTLGGGCSLGVALPLLGWEVLPVGAEGITLGLPTSTALEGLELAFQAVVAGPLIGSFLTNGVQLTLGS